MYCYAVMPHTVMPQWLHVLKPSTGGQNTERLAPAVQISHTIWLAISMDNISGTQCHLGLITGASCYFSTTAAICTYDTELARDDGMHPGKNEVGWKYEEAHFVTLSPGCGNPQALMPQSR
jgi:hypothetical protein